MKMNEVFSQRSLKIYNAILIPIVAFALFFSMIFTILLFNAESKTVALTAALSLDEHLQVFQKLQYQYTPILKEVLTAGSITEFKKETIEEIKEELLSVSDDSVRIGSIKDYRFSEDFINLNPDSVPDPADRLSHSNDSKTCLQTLLPGDIFISGLKFNSSGNIPGFFACMRLPDNSFFEIDLLFTELEAVVSMLSEGKLSGKIISLIFLSSTDKLTENEKDLLNRSLTENTPQFLLLSPIKGRYYIRKQTGYGTYDIMIEINMYYTQLIVLFSLSLFVLIMLQRRSLKKNIGYLVDLLINPIETIDRNLKRFSLKGEGTKYGEIITNIDEINSIANSFGQMRVDITDSYEQLEKMSNDVKLALFENQALLGKVEDLLRLPEYLLYIKNMDEFLIMSFRKFRKMVGKTSYGFVAVNDNEIYRFLEIKGAAIDKINALHLKVGKHNAVSKLALFNFEKDGEYIGKHRVPELYEEFGDVRQTLTIPITSVRNYYGGMTLIIKGTETRFTEDDIRTARYFSDYLKGYLIIRELSELESDLQKETINAVIRILEQHDPYTKGHSESVAQLSSEFGRFLGLSENKVNDLYWAGIVHDMGKILVPHSILNKKDRLNTKEYETLKNHPKYAYDVFKDSSAMKEIAVYIRHHHERYDGTGYPDNLRGKEIPYESRILTIADAWDAMISDRVYKRGITTEMALQEIKRFSGTQFDPDLVKQWSEFIKSGNLLTP